MIANCWNILLLQHATLLVVPEKLVEHSKEQAQAASLKLLNEIRIVVYVQPPQALTRTSMQHTATYCQTHFRTC